jgi:multidrug efflux pump subunit AcrB
MTTAAMVFGVVPLVIASGAGAGGRQSMGIVIFTGLSDWNALYIICGSCNVLLLGS